jgi:hypothetical protein
LILALSSPDQCWSVDRTLSEIEPTEIRTTVKGEQDCLNFEIASDRPTLFKLTVGEEPPVAGGSSGPFFKSGAWWGGWESGNTPTTYWNHSFCSTTPSTIYHYILQVHDPITDQYEYVTDAALTAQMDLKLTLEGIALIDDSDDLSGCECEFHVYLNNNEIWQVGDQLDDNWISSDDFLATPGYEKVLIDLGNSRETITLRMRGCDLDDPSGFIFDPETWAGTSHDCAEGQISIPFNSYKQGIAAHEISGGGDLEFKAIFGTETLYTPRLAASGVVIQGDQANYPPPQIAAPIQNATLWDSKPISTIALVTYPATLRMKLTDPTDKVLRMDSISESLLELQNGLLVGKSDITLTPGQYRLYVQAAISQESGKCPSGLHQEEGKCFSDWSSHVTFSIGDAQLLSDQARAEAAIVPKIPIDRGQAMAAAGASASIELDPNELRVEGKTETPTIDPDEARTAVKTGSATLDPDEARTAMDQEGATSIDPADARSPISTPDLPEIAPAQGFADVSGIGRQKKEDATGPDPDDLGRQRVQSSGGGSGGKTPPDLQDQNISAAQQTSLGSGELSQRSGDATAPPSDSAAPESAPLLAKPAKGSVPQQFTPTHFLTISPAEGKEYASAMPIFIKTISPLQTEIQFILMRLPDEDSNAQGQEVDNWEVEAMEPQNSGQFVYQTTRQLPVGQYLLRVGPQNPAVYNYSPSVHRRFSVVEKPAAIGAERVAADGTVMPKIDREKAAAGGADIADIEREHAESGDSSSVDVGKPQIQLGPAELSPTDVEPSPSTVLTFQKPVKYGVYETHDNENTGNCSFVIITPEKEDIEVKVLQKAQAVFIMSVPKERLTGYHGNQDGRMWMGQGGSPTPLAIGKYTIQARQPNGQNRDWSQPIPFYIGMAAALKDPETGALPRSSISLYTYSNDDSSIPGASDKDVDSNELSHQRVQSSDGMSQRSGDTAPPPSDSAHPEAQPLVTKPAAGSVPAELVSNRFSLVSPFNGQSYASASGMLAPVVFKMTSPQQTQFGYELRKRLSVDDDYHTVRTWFFNDMEPQADGTYAFAEIKPLGPGHYQVITTVNNAQITNHDNPPTAYFSVVGEFVADKALVFIREPKQNQIYDTYHQGNVQFNYWLEMPNPAPVELQLIKDSQVVSTEILTGTGSGGDSSYRGTKQAPRGKYSIRARPTEPADWEWSEPVTFYLDVVPFEEDSAETTAMLAAPSNTKTLETSSRINELAAPSLTNTLTVPETSDSSADTSTLKRLTPKSFMTISPVEGRIYNSSMPIFIKTISPEQTDLNFEITRFSDDGSGAQAEMIENWWAYGMEEQENGIFSYQTARTLPPGDYFLRVDVQNGHLLGGGKGVHRKFSVADKTVAIGRTAAQRSGQAQADTAGTEISRNEQTLVKKGADPGDDGISDRAAPTVIPMSRATEFSTSGMTSLPVKHVAGQQPVFEFEQYDGRAWRTARSIRPISMRPQPGGGTQVITDASFRITEPGRYRYRVRTDGAGSEFSPYQEFIVTDPRTQAAAVASIQRSRARAAAGDAEAAGPPSAAKQIDRVAAATGGSSAPANSANLQRGSDSTTPSISAQRQLMPPSTPPRITAPRPNETFTAPADVAIKTSHDSRFNVVYEVRRSGEPRYNALTDSVLRGLPAGTYDLQAGYDGMPQKSQISFTVRMPIQKQAVQARPQPQVKPQIKKQQAPLRRQVIPQ